MKVTALKLKDVYDKEQKYILIGEGENKVIINVGDKTFNKVDALLKKENEQKEEKVKK